MRETSIDVQAQLKALRLNGMATAWADLTEQGGDTTLAVSRWLVEHLLQAEDADRAMRSIAHQMKSARFPMHRDLAGYDFTVAQVDRTLIQKLADLSFTQDAQNVVLVCGPGTGKTHLATALGIAGITRHAKRVRFYSTVDLVNALEHEKSQGRDFGGYKAGFAQGITEAGCLAHARRKFFDLHAAHKSQIAGFALEQFAKVYDIEREVKELNADLRQSIRQQHSKPVLDALHQWMTLQRQKLPDSSATARAL